MVVADSLELPALPVEEEALVGYQLDAAYAEAGHIFVDLASVLADGCHSIVEGGVFGAPELRFHDRDVLHEAEVRPFGSGGPGDRTAFGVAYLGAYSVSPFDGDLDVDEGLLAAYRRGGHLCAPYRNMHLVGDNDMDIPVEAGAGIPAGGFRKIVEPYRQHIVAAVGVHIIGDVIVEGDIAVGPVAHELPVEEHLGAAHGSVEEYLDALVGRVVGNVEADPVPAGTGVGEPSGASGLERGFGLVVLGDGDHLGVVAGVERPVYGPVVGHGHALPAAVVEVAGGEVSVSAGEPPPFLEQEFLPGALCECERRREQQRCDA